jgi:hypothetical protein
MDPSIVGALIGLFGSAIVGGIGWIGKRNSETMTKLTSSLSNIEKVVTEIRIELPTKYVTKEEMLRHIESGQKWQNHVDSQLIQIREELSSVRDWSHRQ